ncbi:hypothetical protein KJ742_01105 [Patescibacteria group bacterium]|nr:hypothetical protein [Patescibacteria group bacterium]MBU1682522.1 hypothetical protein [Patescibacteria group bacterium]
MNLRRIKHMLLRLSNEEKIIGIGCILIIIGSFLPWHSIVLNFDNQSITQNGFGGDLGVVGFVIFIMAILALFVLIAEHLHIKIPYLGYTKEQILLFLMGENAFLVLITIAIYTKRSLEFTDANLRFGIYLALIGAFLGAFAAFAQIQKLKKEEVQEFFDHEEPVGTRHDTSGEEYEEEMEEPEPEAELFEEEAEAEPEPVEEEDEVVEDEMIEDVEMETEEESESKDQADYFTREAGISEKDIVADAETVDEEDDKDKTSNISMNFYEDQ